MRPGVVRISAVLLAVLMSFSFAVTMPSSSADSAEYGEYGAVYDFDYAEFDAAVKDATGKTVGEWITLISSELGGYDVITDADLDARFATTRDTVQKDGVYTITDHTSGYLSGKLDVNARGSFPNAGTYHRNEGEDTLDFVKRVFKDESGGVDRSAEAHSKIEIYIDTDLVSHVDLGTGEVTDTYLTVKFAIYESGDRDITIDFTEDDEGELETLTFEYGKVAYDNNLFTNTEIAFTIEDMPLFVGDDQWAVRPSVTEHVNKLVLSSDLANSLWLKVVKMMDDDKETKLPDLILELMGSGGRRLDLFATIRSLTGSDVSDVTFVDSFNGSQYTDDRGYRYSRLVSTKDAGPTFDLPRAAYTLNYGEIALLIPDTIIDGAGRIALAVFFGAIGWNDIDVGDISDDPQTRFQCKGIRDFVNEMITEDNVESYSVPEVYIGVAAVGISASVIVLLLMWRRII